MSKSAAVILKSILLFSAVILVAGCNAKKINIRPIDYDYALLAKRINGQCGICISDEDLNKQVVEGGIDTRYSYAPYKDFRYALGVALKQACPEIRFYKSKEEAIAGGAKLGIVPRIETKSDNSFPYWPPDDFTITLDAELFDATGESIQRIHAASTASATSSDWDANYGYAGSKAMEKVVDSFLSQLDYNKINATMASPGSPTADAADISDKPEARKMTQVINLYQGVLEFPPALWVDGLKDLGNSNTYRNQQKDRFTLEFIPKDQKFDGWKQLYGIYGFHLPDYDMKRFTQESINALALGCKEKAKITVAGAENGSVLLTYLCTDLIDPLVKDGDNAERLSPGQPG